MYVPGSAHVCLFCFILTATTVLLQYYYCITTVLLLYYYCITTVLLLYCTVSDYSTYIQSLSKVRREKSATGALQIGESVTEKTKSRV